MDENVMALEEKELHPPQTESKKHYVYAFIKRAFDILVSGAGLIILSPVLLVIAILIKAEDKGPVLHRRVCVGKNNSSFIMYKFRTMVPDADDYEKYFQGEELASFLRGEKVRTDPRITKCGAFLRKTSLDELMQFVSVLRGDMSLIGPRPVIEREAEAYGDKRDLLLSCKPGITGWWQINGRDDIAYLSEETMNLQLYYVERQSLGLDAKIFLKTILVVLKREGAR